MMVTDPTWSEGESALLNVSVNVSSLSTCVSSLTDIEKQRGLSAFEVNVPGIEIGAKSSLDPGKKK